MVDLDFYLSEPIMLGFIYTDIHLRFLVFTGPQTHYYLLIQASLPPLFLRFTQRNVILLDLELGLTSPLGQVFQNTNLYKIIA